MSYLEIDGRRHPIPLGDVALGCDSENRVTIGEESIQLRGAILQGTPEGQVVIRRATPEAEILINGVRLGPQPTPLLHGDKIELAGQELLFVEDRRGGSTNFMQAMDPAMMQAALNRSASKVATAGTGGRLVSLTDGREYSISGGSLLLGRDAGCDVVVANKNVSRRHAEIVATPKGYILIDSSTNGTWVNNERVQGQRVLARADVVKCGDDEFRFYADALSEPAQRQPVQQIQEPGSPLLSESLLPNRMDPPVPAQDPELATPAALEPRLPPSVQPRASVEPPSAEPPEPPPGAMHRLADTMHGLPVVPRPRPEQPRAADPGAEHRLSDTMYGAVPEQGKQGAAADPPSPTPPRGALRRLADTLMGIPTEPRKQPPDAPRVSPPAVPSAGSARPAAARKQTVPRIARPARPAQPGVMREPLSDAVPRTTDTARDSVERFHPRRGEKEGTVFEGSFAQKAVDPRDSKPSAPPALAWLVVRSEPLRGTRFEIRVPVVNVGRADYNDVVIPDESVSTVHAKIQRREGIWVLVDEGSTNGTVVDGERVTGETVLPPGAIIGFGAVLTIFQPADDAADVQLGGATKVIGTIDSPPRIDERQTDSSSADS